MASQKTKPDPGSRERERTQLPRSPRGRIGGYGGLAAILVVVFVMVASLFALWNNDVTPDAAQQGGPSTNGPTGSPQTTGPGESQQAKEGPNRFRLKGSEPAFPESGNHGQVVMSESSGDKWVNGHKYAVYVFADRRVIWHQRTGGGGTTTHGWLVRRLTPKAMQLIPHATPAIGRSELSHHRVYLDPLGLPESAWEDPASQPYRATRYVVCPRRFLVPHDLLLLPARAQDLLRGSEEGYIGRCLVVTAGDDRRLDRILSRADGFERVDLFAGHEYSFDSGSGIASFDVFPVLPNATFEVWS
jgi:hypothetical protein